MESYVEQMFLGVRPSNGQSGCFQYVTLGDFWMAENIATLLPPLGHECLQRYATPLKLLLV